MGTLSYFESRPGKLSDTPEDVYKFVTNLRNFEQFVPADSVRNWQAEKESCSFDVPVIGTVGVRIAQKQEFSKVVYNGDALKKNDFSIVLNIVGEPNANAEVNVQLNADIDPMMQMVATKPIRQFLDTLVERMESFRGWKEGQ
jgi:carbon monoxide dehydrogenase subunit G